MFACLLASFNTIMSSHTASSSNGGNGSGDSGAPRRNSKRPKCDSLLYFSFFFLFYFGQIHVCPLVIMVLVVFLNCKVLNPVLIFLLSLFQRLRYLNVFGITSGFYRHPCGGLCIFLMGSCYFDSLLVLLHESGRVSSFLIILFHIKNLIFFILII